MRGKRGEKEAEGFRGHFKSPQWGQDCRGEAP